MNRRAFLKLFAAAGPVAAIAPTYFFAPVGGWKSDLIVKPDPRMIMVSNPTGPDWLKERFVNAKQREVIESGLPMSLWGLQYWATKPPYISDEYMGISRMAPAGAGILPCPFVAARNHRTCK